MKGNKEKFAGCGMITNLSLLDEEFFMVLLYKNVCRFLNAQGISCIHLPAPGLRCGMQDFELQHVGSSSLIRDGA